jgi:hypothetical protein
LPISNRKLSLEQWLFLVRKLAEKIEPWLGRLLSSGGRLILSSACLVIFPMFSMGLFLLHDEIHAIFDAHRLKFYWEGSGPKRGGYLRLGRASTPTSEGEVITKLTPLTCLRVLVKGAPNSGKVFTRLNTFLKLGLSMR